MAVVATTKGVTRGAIIARGLTNCCPNCGSRSLFPPRSLRIRRDCPECGLQLNHGEGLFLGPWVLNYGVTVFGWVLPAIVMGVKSVIPWGAALGLAAFGCVGLPLLLYRCSWSWWL